MPLVLVLNICFLRLEDKFTSNKCNVMPQFYMLQWQVYDT